tara:strand:+ start:377 stop:1702 length:1326 start_codon:yes stop_codon:yes gene_type:complete
MALKKINFQTEDELKKHIKSHHPTFYYSSQTSTVIPYDKLEKIYSNDDFYLANLSNLPAKMELNAENNLIVRGPVSWKDARDFLKTKNRNIMTAPTEELALITAGAATSATCERCFHFGTLRSQIKKIKYFDFNAKEHTLHADRPLKLESHSLHQYQKQYELYKDFKNAPFPRLENEIDIMIGTEGQLGVITEVEIQTTPNFSVHHLFMLIPKWEENPQAHFDIIHKIQKFRESVIVCELIDSNSFNYLPSEERPNKNLDALFFEIKSEAFEDFYEKFLLSLDALDEENIFEISESKFHNLRAAIPRAVFEKNSQMGVVKMGTDVQVKTKDFPKLIEIYQKFAGKEIKYNLFGHFGDAHLHFNFMPSPDQMTFCQKEFEQMYLQINKINGSPFAEHGIGILKQKYIKNFWTSSIYETFGELKTKFDPHNQFFPQGYMNLSP